VRLGYDGRVENQAARVHVNKMALVVAAGFVSFLLPCQGRAEAEPFSSPQAIDLKKKMARPERFERPTLRFVV
jgi:hypothetical protein